MRPKVLKFKLKLLQLIPVSHDESESESIASFGRLCTTSNKCVYLSTGTLMGISHTLH